MPTQPSNFTEPLSSRSFIVSVSPLIMALCIKTLSLGIGFGFSCAEYTETMVEASARKKRFLGARMFTPMEGDIAEFFCICTSSLDRFTLQHDTGHTNDHSNLMLKAGRPRSR